MITYTSKNLFLIPAQTLVNTVNLRGVMGAGIAKDFKHYYPQMYTKYRNICMQHRFKMGQLMLSKREPEVVRGKRTGAYREKWVLNFPTKDHWRDDSKLEYLEQGLSTLVKTYKVKGITSIAFPKLGSGCGKLSWDKVKPLMEKYLNQLDIPVYISTYNPVHAKRPTYEEIRSNLNKAV